MKPTHLALVLVPALIVAACSSAPTDATSQSEAPLAAPSSTSALRIPPPRWFPPIIIVPPPPACGSGNLLEPLSLTTDNNAAWNTWFGGDNRPPPPVNFHPRNLAYGVTLERAYDSFIDTIGFSTTGPFARASDGLLGAVTIAMEVRDVNGVILSTSSVALPVSFTGGWFDVPVNVFVPKNTPRIFTMYVENGLTTGFYSGLQTRPSTESPDVTSYEATVAVYSGSTYASEASFTSTWAPLWSSAPQPLRFRYSGCQELCGAVNCDDGNACTVDSCDAPTGACLHSPLSCDDGIGCTVDSCDPKAGCGHAPDATLCPAQPHCDSARVCSPTTGCGIDCTDGSICTTDSCDDSTDQCVHVQAPVQLSAADVGGSWDFTMSCGTVSNQNGFLCELTSTGELQAAAADQSSAGPLVTSACSRNGDQFCCFGP
jgi:hypothetical protein